MRTRTRLIATLTTVALAGLAPGATGPAAAKPHPRNGKIAVGNISPGPGVPSTGLTIDPDGSHLRQIGPENDTICTDWSPAGDKILCNVWPDPDVLDVPAQPATANPDGSDFTLLQRAAPDVGTFCYTWSPDGRRLLCGTEGLGLVAVRSSDGGDPRVVTSHLPDGFATADGYNGYGWSPDGTHILIGARDVGDQVNLFVVREDGSQPVRLSPEGTGVIDLDYFDGIGASWSPDSRRVTFAERAVLDDGTIDRAVYTVDVDGAHLRRVTPKGFVAVTAQWSPDARWIALTSRSATTTTPGNRRAWIVHPNGQGLRAITPVTPEADFTAPLWSPDSQWLLLDRFDVNEQASVWTVDVTGNHLTKLIDTVGLVEYDWGIAPLG